MVCAVAPSILRRAMPDLATIVLQIAALLRRRFLDRMPYGQALHKSDD